MTPAAFVSLATHTASTFPPARSAPARSWYLDLSPSTPTGSAAGVPAALITYRAIVEQLRISIGGVTTMA
jgi:hypothetical protein